MSAVSKKLIPASRAACTTLGDRSSSQRIPKLLHPSPTTVTSSDPSLRISTGVSLVVGLAVRFGTGQGRQVTRTHARRSHAGHLISREKWRPGNQSHIGR